jgi:hypothetical protein
VTETPVSKQCEFFSFGKSDETGNELPPEKWRPLCHAFTKPEDVLCPHADAAIHLADFGFQDGPKELRNSFGLCPINPEFKACTKWIEEHPEFGN